MSVLIVHESLFGNTEQLATAVAAGLGGPDHVTTVAAADAPDHIPDDVALLLVAGPTHAFSMTRPGTRADAVTKGARPDRAGTGIREWIERVEPRPELSVVTFDTRVHVKLVPGSAAKSAARALRARGFARTRRGETFWVEDTDGPLRDGELERARAWGESLLAGRC